MNTLYAVARTVLLDALEALDEQRDAVRRRSICTPAMPISRYRHSPPMVIS
jgi:hypothetical protein